jgi:hypothetical protein
MGSEKALALSQAQRKRTVWRFDGGAGSDEQFIWLLKRGYHVIGKGASNRRAKALARQVPRWDAYGDVWLGEAPPPVDYGHPTRVFVKKRRKDDQYRHSYYLTTLSLPSKGRFIKLYDQRGGAEVEQFRNDKDGLSMAARRKRSFDGQKGYIMLTDLAHNLLADFYHQALREDPFEKYGPKRIVRDLIKTPGKLIFDDERLVRIELQKQKPASEALVACLKKYCSGD